MERECWDLESYYITTRAASCIVSELPCNGERVEICSLITILQSWFSLSLWASLQWRESPANKQKIHLHLWVCEHEGFGVFWAQYIEIIPVNWGQMITRCVVIGFKAWWTSRGSLLLLLHVLGAGSGATVVIVVALRTRHRKDDWRRVF
jgi:hypothetical protein